MASNTSIEDLDEQIRRLQERKRELIANEKKERSNMAAQATKVAGELVACALPQDAFSLDLEAFASWLAQNEDELASLCTKGDDASGTRKREIAAVAKSPAKAMQRAREMLAHPSVDRRDLASAE